jgi:hypothetical protein
MESCAGIDGPAPGHLFPLAVKADGCERQLMVLYRNIGDGAGARVTVWQLVFGRTLEIAVC